MMEVHKLKVEKSGRQSKISSSIYEFPSQSNDCNGESQEQRLPRLKDEKVVINS